MGRSKNSFLPQPHPRYLVPGFFIFGVSFGYQFQVSGYLERFFGDGKGERTTSLPQLFLLQLLINPTEQLQSRL